MPSLTSRVVPPSRKAVLTAHPDKGGSEEKMAAVNEAYEVLNDPGMPPPSPPSLPPFLCPSFCLSFCELQTVNPIRSDPLELRQRFDNGDDPNDPTANQGGSPFQGGGFPGQFAQFFQQGFPGGSGGGGGFQFHYSPPGFH